MSGKRKETTRRQEQKEIILAEKRHILGKRPDDNQSYSGLAISGGGIRSASFALGVMQALNGNEDDKTKAENIPDCLTKFDYLSTVSGGGYIGSSLTWFRLHKENSFPFGQKGFGARKGNKNNESNNILSYIRQHGNYLTPCKNLDLASLIAVAIRSMFLSLSVYLSLLILIMLCLHHFEAFKPILPFTQDISLSYFSYGALAVAILMALSSLFFSFTTFSFKPPSPKNLLFKTFLKRGRFLGYDKLLSFQIALGWSSKLFIGLLLLTSLYPVAEFLQEPWLKNTAAGGSTLIGTILGFLQSLKQQETKRIAGKSIGINYKVIAGSFLLIYGLVLTAYIAAENILSTNGVVFWGLLSALLGIGLLIGFFANLNHAGLHRMYRDRLMETFLPNPDNVEEGKEGLWGPATKANKVPLEETHKPGGKLYHLINTNVVLIDSKDAKFRGRGGDSFLLSPLYCGSYATGWTETSNFTKRGKSITLPTAMAISGAAANPNTGVAGKGVTRSKLVSALMTLLNLRLGYWASNPERGDFLLSFWPPNYLFPGIFPGLFSCQLSRTAFDKDSYFLELTDGGHFENLALYELIRREVKFIVVSDGGADPNYSFEDLANAIERIRVDFGVLIEFKRGEKYNLEGIIPESEPQNPTTEKYKLAKRGFAVADICYDREDPDNNGTLIYIKPTMVKNLPLDISVYKNDHKTFPDQTTADQFFDEAQFEAYRELGYQITKDMLLSQNARDFFPDSFIKEEK